MARILVTSRPFLFVPIYGPAGYTAYQVALALVPETRGGEPAEADWHDADWLAPDPALPDDKEAALLIGPGGGIEYSAGHYQCYARLGAGAEAPVIPSGRVTIG